MIRIRSSHAMVLALMTCAASTAAAQSPPADASAAAADAKHPTATVWIYPAIRGYGGVHPRPDVPSGIVPGAEYKVIADVVHGTSDHKQVLGSLTRLARIVNLFAYAGVPPAHVHVAAVIEGDAGFAALNNAAFRKRFNVDNPNLALLHELKAAGVDLMVCAQALAEVGLEDSDISPDVTVTLSALSDFAVYGARGYSYLQL